MNCPVCKVPTFVVEYNEIEIDLCPDCHGVWLDSGELELLLPVAGGVPVSAASTDEAERPCPLCDKTMAKMNIGPSRRVLVDRCADCGMWFDRSEIKDLSRDLGDHIDVDSQLGDFLGRVFPVKGDD